MSSGGRGKRPSAWPWSADSGDSDHADGALLTAEPITNGSAHQAVDNRTMVQAVRRQRQRDEALKSFVVGWGADDTLPEGQPRVPVHTLRELDQILDGIESERSAVGTPIIVEIAEEGSGDGFVTYHLGLSVGHPDRAVLGFK